MNKFKSQDKIGVKRLLVKKKRGNITMRRLPQYLNTVRRSFMKADK